MIFKLVFESISSLTNSPLSLLPLKPCSGANTLVTLTPMLIKVSTI